MDAADVVEISPPVHLFKKSKKRQAILNDVIDIGDGAGSKDLVVIGDEVNKSKRGKTDEAIHQVVEVSDYTSIQPGGEDFGLISEIESSNDYRLAISHDAIAIDNGDDTGDLVIIGENVSKSNNGKIEFPSSQLFSQTAPNKKKFAAPLHNERGLPGNSEVKNLLPPWAVNFYMKHAAVSNRSLHAIMRNFQNFKKFSFVKNPSDHHFIGKEGNFPHCPRSEKTNRHQKKGWWRPDLKRNKHSNMGHVERVCKTEQEVKIGECQQDEETFGSSMEKHSKNWVKAIQKEWKILENNLPDSIFVRVYESRMDLLRALIVGAEGTPYHNGLFFFDIYFPRYYPNVPPLVYSDYLDCNMNPFFGSDGLCLSLLNTCGRSSDDNEYECWIPGVSTILQVLVSIQGLVLNANPYFTYHFALTSKIARVSLLYNESVFTSLLSKMSYTMRRRPKHFEDFVVGHFVSRAHDILEACNAFIKDGARGVLGDFVLTGDDLFRHLKSVNFVRTFTNRLAMELSRIGARDCEKFLSEEIINAGQSFYLYCEKHNSF